MGSTDQHGVKRLIWVFPIVFLIQATEEILTIRGLAHQHLTKPQGSLVNLFPQLMLRFLHGTFAQVVVAAGIELTLVLLATFLAGRAIRPGPAINFFTLVVSILFLDVFIRVAQTVVFRAYTPGVVTSVLISLPYSLYVFRRLLHDRLVRRPTFVLMLAGGALAGIPIALSALAIGGLLTR